jgi:putative pyruvate formate lyase activating enzyme
MHIEPSYRQLYETGRLKEIASQLEEIVKNCTLCPHQCRVDRSLSKEGFCRSGTLPIVSSWNAHFGEESVLVGRRGSGTIFFTNCNMCCVYCQNYDISQLGNGREVSYSELAEMMMALKDRGCHNINFVTPTHMVFSIVQALLLAIPRGLDLPLVYNSGGYDSLQVLTMLAGVFDIYMPDFKYADREVAFSLSGVKEYPKTAMEAIREMHRQVGDLFIDERGIALRGLLVRHLVLPNEQAGTRKVIDFLSELSRYTYLNIMDQYRPLFRAHEHPDLGRMVTLQEIDEAVSYARQSGMVRVIS